MKIRAKSVLSIILMLCLCLTLMLSSASADFSCTEGDSIEWTLTQNTGADDSTTFQTVTITSSGCPGLSAYLGFSNTAVMLGGTPTTAGVYLVDISYTMVNGDVGSFSVLVNINPSGDTPEESAEPTGKLTITKSPTGETLDAGEDALFIAAAQNYTSIEWRVLTPDKNNCWRNEDEITGAFSGLGYTAYTGDDGRDYLYLTNIPTSMNGYVIEAKYYDASGNTAFTEPAVLVVNGELESTPTPSPTPTPEPTSTPETEVVTPEPTQVPVETVAPTVTPSTESTSHKSEKKDNTLLIAGAAAGAVLLCGLTIIIMRIKLDAEDKARKGR